MSPRLEVEMYVRRESDWWTGWEAGPVGGPVVVPVAVESSLDDSEFVGRSVRGGRKDGVWDDDGFWISYVAAQKRKFPDFVP